MILTFELLSDAPWAHKGHQRGQDLHLFSFPCPASRRWHSPGKFLMSWSLPILTSQLVAQAGGVRGRVSSPLALLALWAVGDQQYLDTSQPRSHSTRGLSWTGALTDNTPLWALHPQHPGVHPTPDSRLHTGGLTPREGNILGGLSTGKSICRPGRKSLDEICIAIFQTSWERLQNNSLHWSSGAGCTIIAAIISTKQGDNTAAALYSASTPAFLLPRWAWRQITHQRACPRVAEIMKILRNWLHCLYKQHAHSCLPLKKMLFVGFLAFSFLPSCLLVNKMSVPSHEQTNSIGMGMEILAWTLGRSYRALLMNWRLKKMGPQGWLEKVRPERYVGLNSSSL